MAAEVITGCHGVIMMRYHEDCGGDGGDDNAECICSKYKIVFTKPFFYLVANNALHY